MRILIMAALLALSACSPPAPPQAPPSEARSNDDGFLDGLAGDWIVEGEMQGLEVRHRAHGARTIDGLWFEFHMTDTDAPSHYDARIFIIADTTRQDYAAHWLDTVGIPGARVVGTGVREGNVLTLTYPHEEGAFRNTWTHLEDGNWTLLVESQQRDRSWSTFASYTIRRT